MKSQQSFFQKVFSTYSTFLTAHPYIIFSICIVIILIAGIGAGNVQNTSFDSTDALPSHLSVIAANERFSADFGGTNSVMIVLETNPTYVHSNELRDVRSPLAMNYLDIVSQAVIRSNSVDSIRSPTDTLRLMNQGVLPGSSKVLRDMIAQNSLLHDFFSADGTMVRMTINLRSDYSQEELVADLEDALRIMPAPPGTNAQIAGALIADTFLQRELGDDMSRTSMIAIGGIIVVLVLLFGSIKYGLLPLATIGIGVLWTFGYLGLTGIGINSATSGVLSMIIGIGIDFGIQIISRYRQELRTVSAIVAMKKSLDTTLFPMFVTTIAAVIGFSSMSMGQLSILKQIGDIMTLGVIFCFLAAATFVPAFILILENLTQQIKQKYITYKEAYL